MKQQLLSLLAIGLILVSGCDQKDAKPRIAIAGIAIESSTFSPAESDMDAFRVTTGEEIFGLYPFFEADSGLRQAADWVPTLRARAIPGGIVTRETYETLVDSTLKMLESNLPYDGLFFDIHGAMSVIGLDDPEGNFIRRIREVVGTETVISTSMDLHGNVTEELAYHSDLITCYRMAPHEDAIESKKRAAQNLVDRLVSGKGKPAFKAWIPVPILLPGEKTSTRIEPGKSLYDQVAPVAARTGILDAAIWIGYAWADEHRNHGVVMVTGDDQEAVGLGAAELARSFWEVRHAFDFVAPVAPLSECLDLALKSDKKPFIISDMGDNPTAGGAGDVTWTLARLLERKEFKDPAGPELIYASIPGPELVRAALLAGEGATISAEVGGLVDHRYEPPVMLHGKILKIREGDGNAAVEVVIQSGSLKVIVTNQRKPYHYRSDFSNLDLEPQKADIVMVKIGYLVPELYDMRGDWIMALTPGGVDQDLGRLGYKRIRRPMFPLDPDMADPDLSVRWIALSHEPFKRYNMSDLPPKVTGIGGVFFKSEDPAKVREWYKQNLGLAMNDWGSAFEFRNAHNPDEINYLSWSPFDEKTSYF